MVHRASKCNSLHHKVHSRSHKNVLFNFCIHFPSQPTLVLMTSTRQDLTNAEREAVIRTILVGCKGNVSSRLPKGLLTSIAVKFHITPRGIQKIWHRAKKNGIVDGNMAASVASLKKGNSGRKPRYTAHELRTKLLAIPVRYRTTLRAISSRIGTLNMQIPSPNS